MTIKIVIGRTKIQTTVVIPATMHFVIATKIAKNRVAEINAYEITPNVITNVVTTEK